MMCKKYFNRVVFGIFIAAAEVTLSGCAGDAELEGPPVLLKTSVQITPKEAMQMAVTNYCGQGGVSFTDDNGNKVTCSAKSLDCPKL